MLRIYNSLTRQIEDFKPFHPLTVGIYTCGPTVYLFAHIGNFRAYFTSDLLVRTLRQNGYIVKFVMNITDVGHLTNDQIGGADTGEDKIERTAKKEGKTVWEVAQFYTDGFLDDYNALNYVKPDILAKATDHITEQINLIKRLEEKGYTYQTGDGIYFDTSIDRNYGRMSNLDTIKEGARVEINPEKRNPQDFALWKFSGSPEAGERRQMEWYFEGPLAGKLATKDNWIELKKRNDKQESWFTTFGFPGWHIECSAMSMKYLGETFDIHTGGIDHREIHHPNEIAQSEAATGKTFAQYWVHTAFMLVTGLKMSKSLNNIYRLYDLEKAGYDPLALRYLYMQTHYRQEMNFTFTALDAAQNALQHLRDAIMTWDDPRGGINELEEKFMKALNNDLNIPEALSVVWELVKSDHPSSSKAASIFRMDEILGLQLSDWKEKNRKMTLEQLPRDVREMVHEREVLRKNRQYTKADHMRNRIKKLGYDVLDTKDGTEIKRIEISRDK